MPPTLNDTAARRAPDPDLSVNRKLIRPSLAEVRDQLARSASPGAGGAAGANSATPHMAPAPSFAPGGPGVGHASHTSAGAAGAAASRLAKKPVPPDQTNAESFYFLKQMQSKTDMVLVLRDGERVRGVIEWYDRHCLKVHRTGEPNLLIYKDIIKYMYKAEEESKA